MEKLENILDEVLTDEQIKKFVLKHNLDRKVLINYLPILMTQAERNKKCLNCKGKKICIQEAIDMCSHLSFYNNKIDFVYKKCQYKELLNEDFVEMLFVPENNYVGGSELFKVAPRANILKGIMTFLDEYLAGLKPKGMYIHGSFGVGKTFLLLKLANKLAKNDIKVLFVYYPDLVRSLKSAIGTNNLEMYVEKLKKAEVLFLDDFGAENNSAFIRDEVLGPILEYRMNEKLPMFIASNKDLRQLHDHLKETNNDTNEINSSRILERIKMLTNVYELKDRDYRNI